ncbi:hypothetical protein K2P97_04905 [bacterium]|nr:hypothetical protein [bacterium]
MLSKLKYTLLFVTLSSLTFSCASRLKTPPGVPEVSISEYESAVSDRTQKIEVYDGFYNKLTVQATWLDTKLSDYALSYNARLSQWNEATYKEERTKRVNKNAESTEFFVSFYTPERKHSDLVGSKNLWKIYLDVNGQRYQGKPSKMKLLYSEVQSMYPHHSRWSNPYIVSFPVATSLVDNKDAILTFTGAVGSAQINFKAQEAK